MTANHASAPPSSSRPDETRPSDVEALPTRAVRGSQTPANHDLKSRATQHTISALVQNEAGTLNRLVSLFRRRGFSLASLNAGDCEQEGFSRLTLVVNGDDADLRQCLRQLEKLIDVVEVEDLGPDESVRRELALVQVNALPDQRGPIVEIVQILGGKVAWLAPDRMAVEMTDEPAKIQRLIEMLTPFGIHEVVRTGLVAMKVA